jgi:hypothetical protein
VRAKFKAGLAGIALIGCSAGVVTWFGDRWWPQHSPQDFEQCSAQVESTSSSKDEQMVLIAQCSKQFVGRRKTGGGYTYYDFLQNRHFDIAGPNPTPKELKIFRRTVHVISGRPTERSSCSRPCRTAKPNGATRVSGRSCRWLDISARTTCGDRPD